MKTNPIPKKVRFQCIFSAKSQKLKGRLDKLRVEAVRSENNKVFLLKIRNHTIEGVIVAK